LICPGFSRIKERTKTEIIKNEKLIANTTVKFVGKGKSIKKLITPLPIMAIIPPPTDTNPKKRPLLSEGMTFPMISSHDTLLIPSLE
jgi:hypothetical protein